MIKACQQPNGGYAIFNEVTLRFTAMNLRKKELEEKLNRDLGAFGSQALCRALEDTPSPIYPGDTSLPRGTRRWRHILEQLVFSGKTEAAKEAEKRGSAPFSRHLFFIASKTAHADKWRKLQEEGVPLGFTWYLMQNWDQTPDALRGRFWVENLQELKKCTCLILYCEPKEQQQGGLIETGVALSEGIPVIVVYQLYTPLPLPSWTCHPLVKVVYSLEAAFEAAKEV